MISLCRKVAFAIEDESESGSDSGRNGQESEASLSEVSSQYEILGANMKYEKFLVDREYTRPCGERTRWIPSERPLMGRIQICFLGPRGPLIEPSMTARPTHPPALKIQITSTAL